MTHHERVEAMIARVEAIVREAYPTTGAPAGHRIRLVREIQIPHDGREEILTVIRHAIEETRARYPEDAVWIGCMDGLRVLRLSYADGLGVRVGCSSDSYTGAATYEAVPSSVHRAEIARIMAEDAARTSG